MSAAIRLREDFDGPALRALAMASPQGSFTTLIGLQPKVCNSLYFH